MKKEVERRGKMSETRATGKLFRQETDRKRITSYLIVEDLPIENVYNETGKIDSKDIFRKEMTQ
jgi:hypothetical protein